MEIRPSLLKIYILVFSHKMCYDDVVGLQKRHWVVGSFVLFVASSWWLSEFSWSIRQKWQRGLDIWRFEEQKWGVFFMTAKFLFKLFYLMAANLIDFHDQLGLFSSHCNVAFPSTHSVSPMCWKIHVNDSDIFTTRTNTMPSEEVT